MANRAKKETKPKQRWDWATSTYKIWVRETMVRKGLSFEDVATRVTRLGQHLTSGGLSSFLGREGEVPTPSSCRFMVQLNKVLGASPPPVCDPTDRLAQFRDAFAARWAEMTPEMRRVVATAVGVEPPADE